jgi:hypothetical protein
VAVQTLNMLQDHDALRVKVMQYRHAGLRYMQRLSSRPDTPQKIY